MTAKTYVITGATSGIGEAAALELGRLGADLILIGRNEDRGRSIVTKISKLRQRGRIEFLRTNLASPREVRKTAAILGEIDRPIDGLINNAGARFDNYGRNEDGHELTFATNHLGHFLLTGLLWEKVIAAPLGRVITVTSGSHGSAHTGEQWELEKSNYDRKQAYAKSKLANVLFAYELARRLEGTKAISCDFDPGGVASNFARNNGWLSWGKHIVSHAIRRELVSSRTAARALMALATAVSTSTLNGAYYQRMNPARSSADSYNADLARGLWTLSVAATGPAGLPARYAS